MRKFIVSAAAAAMVLGSTVAQAAPVAIDNARSGSDLTGEALARTPRTSGLACSASAC